MPLQTWIVDPQVAAPTAAWIELYLAVVQPWSLLVLMPVGLTYSTSGVPALPSRRVLLWLPPPTGGQNCHDFRTLPHALALSSKADSASPPERCPKVDPRHGAKPPAPRPLN